MAGQRSLASEYDDDSSRCQKTDGRRWRCPMPAQPNKSFCSHHRLAVIKTPPSLHQNPSQSLDRRKTGPGEAEEDSKHDNFGSDKKRRRRKEMAVSDIVTEKSLNPVDASTKKHGIKKKKIERSGAKQVSDSLSSDKGEVDLVIEKGNLGSGPVKTITKKRERMKKKLVDSNYLLNPDEKEDKADISEESEAELVPIAHDLMWFAVKRQIEKNRKKLNKGKESEVRKALPNGVMAISPTPITFSSNTVQALDKRIGLVVPDNYLMQRRFRSKNVEPEPVAVVKKLPIMVSRGEKKGKGVQESGRTDIQRGTATDIFEKLTGDEHGSSSIQCTDYMISQLQPVLKPLCWEQVLELEIEANNQGRNLADVRVQTIEYTQDMQYKCKFCRASIVNLLRGCSNCCYKLCLSCCQEIRGKNLPKEEEIMASGYATKQKRNHPFAETHHTKKKGSFSSKTGDEQIPCPPTRLGGCGQEVLVMKLLLPHGMLESIVGGSNRG